MRAPTEDLEPSNHVRQNVETIGALVSEAEHKITSHQRAVEGLTRIIGRPRTLYVIVGAVLTWALYNVEAPHWGFPRLDEPPFFWLQGLMSLAALLTTVMVLTTQNRGIRDVEKRAHLDLQVNLLTEQKVAKLIALLEELRRDLPNVENRRDPVAERMQEPVDPAAVASELEQTLGQVAEAALDPDTQDEDDEPDPIAGPVS